MKQKTMSRKNRVMQKYSEAYKIDKSIDASRRYFHGDEKEEIGMPVED